MIVLASGAALFWVRCHGSIFITCVIGVAVVAAVAASAGCALHLATVFVAGVLHLAQCGVAQQA